MNTIQVPIHKIGKPTDLTAESQHLLQDAEIAIPDILNLANEFVDVELNLASGAIFISPEEIADHAKRTAAYAITLFELVAHSHIGFVDMVVPAIIVSDNEQTKNMAISRLRCINRQEHKIKTLYEDAVYSTKKYLKHRDHARAIMEAFKSFAK